MIQALRAFFANPARQAAAWAGLGIAGILLAAGGVYFLLEGGGGTSSAAPDATRTSTATATTSAAPSTNTPTITPTRVGLTATAFAAQEAARTRTASAAGTATAQVTPTPAANPTQPQGQQPVATAAPATATPTEEPPTQTPTAVATETNLVYCDATGGGATPPSAIFGIVTVAGEAAPEGTIVTIAFNGVPSLSGTVTVSDGVAGYRFLYGVGGGGCTNSAGASIAVIVNGQWFDAPIAVGGEPSLRFDVDAS